MNHKHKTILFMEDDQHFLSVMTEVLEKEGYRVIPATTIAAAEKTLDESYVHLGIFDIRMGGEGDTSDTSGLNLAKQKKYRHIPKIILTAHPSYEYVREVMGKGGDDLPPAVDFLSKDEGPDALLAALEKAFDEHIKINWDLTIIWGQNGMFPPNAAAAMLESAAETDAIVDRALELEDLIRRIFFEYSQVNLSLPLWCRNGSCGLKGVAFKAQSGREEHQIRDHFIINISVQVPGRVEAPGSEEIISRVMGTGALFLSAASHNYDAIAWTDHDIDLEESKTFSRYYCENSEKNVRAALETLIATKIGKINSLGRSTVEGSLLAEIYRSAWDHHFYDEAIHVWMKKLSTLASETLALQLVELDWTSEEVLFRFSSKIEAKYPNPLKLLADWPETKSGRTVSGHALRSLGGESLLVDPEGMVSPTDYGRSGISPAHFDFIELENTVRYDLLEVNNLVSIYDFEKQVAALRSLSASIPGGHVEPECKKALGALLTIRKQAASSTADDIQPYRTGLFLQTSHRLARFDPDLQHTRREIITGIHQLLHMSILAQYFLSEPAELELSDDDFEEGLRIDEENQQVFLHGGEISLTPTEFDILAYLDKNAGNLCTRDNIKEAVFGAGEADKESEESRLNTHIGRLREKIEPDKSKPSYILTVHGKGYKLIYPA